MRTLSKLLAISSLALGCASAPVGRSPAANLRGDVVGAGPSVKLVVVGPADIHAYSAFAGGAIYTVPAVSGSDRDCGSTRAGLTTLEPDRVHALRVEAGQVACLAIVKKGSFELMWHGHQDRADPVAVVAVGPRR